MKLQKRILTFAAAAMLALSMALPCAAAESAMDTLCAPSGITSMPDGSFLVTDTYNKVVLACGGPHQYRVRWCGNGGGPLRSAHRRL